VTEDRRLRDKLAKLASEETGGGERRLAGGDLARAILEEIDETILARRLTFRRDDGATLALEVANRRLFGLVVLPGHHSSEDSDRPVAPLQADDEDALQAVAETLRSFAAGRGTLAVTTAPLGRAVGSGTGGRAAAAIARAMGLDLYDRPAPPVTPDPARGFGAGLARLARAVAVVEDGRPSPATGPDTDAVDRLTRLDATAVAALEAELGAGQGGAARFLLLSGAREALFFGRRPDGRAVAAILPADHAGPVAALWRATGGA
jgi:hypothetical protein